MNAKKPTPATDRCEVCRVPLVERPDSRWRRCADHLDQAVLFPLTHVRKTRATTRKEGNR
ncbi:hypothetical protein FVA95_21370 [Pseudonocardia sp. EV170527-09]|uniref:hypothetical protein n=1 Tax=Pseudonocardia sp. EV170527-09 TaxID=2603411 RepID=UPI0011F4010D|nr:hypothetical protein [Pseudonocardia sp. EV170527-09]KAA1020244.1 hypothetical protein FVA95_21370 [Pseudonocardia sp. EV170527-09]